MTNLFWMSTGLAAARRFAEFMLTSCVLSVISTLLNIIGLVNIRPHVMIMLIIGTLIFLVINIIQMRDCYFDLGDLLQYYVANLIAYGLFAAVGVIIYKVSNIAFTWMFGITKFMRYAPFEVSAKDSLLLFYAICGIAILLSPIGLHKVVAEGKQAMLEVQESMELFEEQMNAANAKEDEE